MNEPDNTFDDYVFQQFHIPGYMMDGILRYVHDGIPPGGFLTAVICNDLREAVQRADDTNIANIPAYVAYFYKETPSICWGSPERMDQWIKNKVPRKESK